MTDPSGGTALHVYSIENDAFVVVLGLLDSGARHNWISRDLVVRLGLCPVKLAEQADFEDFQGGVLTAYEHVKLNWYGKSKCKREGYFMVAEKGPFDIVIGSDFLFSEKVFTYNGTVLMNELNPESEENKKKREKSGNDQTNLEAVRQAARKVANEVKNAVSPQGNAQSSTGTQGGQSGK